MSEFAWLGRKTPCGCPVFARLHGHHIRGPGEFPKNLKIKRVPIERASVSICRCND